MSAKNTSLFKLYTKSLLVKLQIHLKQGATSYQQINKVL